MVAGREASPQDVNNTERLKFYWAHGAGADQIQWGSPGDFNRCVTQLSKYVPPGEVHGECFNLHVEALGYSPQEHAKMDKAATPGKKP